MLSDYKDLKPVQMRRIIRGGGYTEPTSGLCPGYAQANLVILPGQWANVTLEQVAAWDPDALVVISYATPATTAVECLATSPAWTSLRCWRTGRVYPMPGDFCSWDLPDPRWLLGLQWMATRLLPPDAFPDFFSMEQALVDFYALLGLSPATTRAKLLPLIPEPL